MSTKGPIDARIDVGALNEVIVYANQYRPEVSAKADAIRTVCRKMEDEESLKGGDGDHIRECFATIAKGCNQLDKSTEKIVAVLNDKLATAIGMRHGATSNAASEAVTSANKKVGFMNKE